MEFSRRQFLAGIGVAGAAAAGAGLVGCAPQQTQTSTTTEETATEELLHTAYVNPQDYDYRGNTTDFATLLSPWKLGSIEIGNRMAKSAAGSACYLAGYTDELFEYYLNFAKGGVEMIWVEGEFLPTGDFTDEVISFGKRLSEACAEYNAHLGCQWAFSGDVPNMTVDDILAAEERAVTVAKNLQSMGFEAMEINAAGFNLGSHFLSRYHNTRTDDYGMGSLENRARFVVECIQKMKEACGDDFAVQILIDCIEELDNITNNPTLMTLDNQVTAFQTKATTIEEGIEFAKMFEAAGADSMHLRLGPLGNHPCQFASDLYFILNGIEGASGFATQFDFNKHFQGALIGNHSGAGMLLDVVARYKEQLSIPCGTVTYMDPAHAPDFFEQALVDGKCDFYLMNRPFTVDTEYVNKLKEGRLDEIAPCTRCLHCHIGSNEMNAQMGYCRVNALTQRVMREGGPSTYEVPAAETTKKVMVIGGGPAGMEAARIAAQRGHSVTLYEKSGALGGKLEFASNVKGPHENLTDLSAYLSRQLEVNGVSVELNKEVDTAFIDSEAPDAVILAVGGKRPEAPVSGNDSVQVVDFDSFMMTEMGDNVVIWGSNAQAFDCALWLTVHKKNVVIVTPSANEELDMQQSQHAIRFMTTALYALGLRVWPSSSIQEVGDGSITIQTETGTTVSIPCDAIVNAGDMLPDTSLIDGCSVSETYAVGDCNEPFNIALAIRSGNDAGRTV